jgi:general stress protein 26
MKIHAQADAAMQRLAELVETHRTALLTFDEGDGLASRPMTPLEMDGEGRFWFMASRRSLTTVGDGTRMALAFSDEARSQYVSITAEATLVDQRARKHALWSITGRPWFDGPDDPDLVLLALTPLRAEIWDGPHGTISRVLAMAASVVAGREIGLGHKETITPKPAGEPPLGSL